MPAVFVHGVPDTSRVWRPVIERLRRKDVVTLSLAEWEADLKNIATPGLVFWGADDPYAAPTFGERLASHTRARFVQFPGCSHWWQLQRAGGVAAELEAHWS